MKHSLRTKMTAIFLVVVLLFTSNYMILHAFAEDTMGVGIYNNLMTADNTATSRYILKFYTHDENGVEQRVSFPSDMQISGADYLVMHYLKETTGVQGYQTNPNRFCFTVSLNEISNVINDTQYTETAVTGIGSDLKFGGADFTAAAAVQTLANLPQTLKNQYNATIPSVHGIPNEENMSYLKMKKVDKVEAQNNNPNPTPLPGATYYLLRLYNYEYRKPGAQSDTAENYLPNALTAARNPDYSTNSTLWTYWEKIGDKQTDVYGQITFDGHMFGTYILYEVKSPDGYERDFTYSDTLITSSTANVLGPVEFHSTNAQHLTEVYNLTHKEPRKDARIKVLKTDENGNPLRGATFDLYLDDATPTKIGSTVTTDYNGMNAEAIVLDSDQYTWDQPFYFIETTPPKGYAADNEGDAKTKISFTLSRALADETLHVVRANDVRLKGKVTLTKTSSAATTANPAGTVLAGAQYQLCQKGSNQPLSLYQKGLTASYRVTHPDDVAATITQDGYTVSPTVTTLTTGNDGKLHIEGLDWGDYYLQEILPPDGYTLPAGDAAKVFFSVGRNTVGRDAQNNPIIQQLTMKNDPVGATLNIIKHIDEKNVAAWGTPTFIFKLRQTAYVAPNGTLTPIPEADQPTLTKTVSPDTADNTVSGYPFKGETGAFNIEPGTYTITEVRVARYRAEVNAAVSETSESKVTSGTCTPSAATLTVAPDGHAVVDFYNELVNYEKLSHTDQANNRFNGIKALDVKDKDGLTLNAQGSVTINKSELYPELVKSDGTTASVTDYSKLVITMDPADAEVTFTDNGNTITLSGRKEDISSSVYRMKAVYDGRFTDTFELRFAADTLFSKKEVTVIFRNDAANKSYYEVNSAQQHFNTYALTFIIETASGGATTVRRILHDGVDTGKTNQTAFPTAQIERTYADRVEFDTWSYKINSGTATNATPAQLLTAIVAANDGAVVDVTAVLKNKSS